ncbi:MAG: GNAT family N-acetyltransferase [Xanthobacteraceae bacterium]|nr:MAG: GNAT family N-acetyltransferase [Xanthobacteraceae bacterium]
MTGALFTLRAYRAGDEEAVLALWLRTWQAAYPAIDFAARLAWWRARWRDELVPVAAIIVAEGTDALVGFVTIDAAGYLDQLVVAPEAWGTPAAAALMDAAKERSPRGISLMVNADNARAIAFYARHGFREAGTGVNQLSGRPVLRMSWTP